MCEQVRQNKNVWKERKYKNYVAVFILHMKKREYAATAQIHIHFRQNLQHKASHRQ